MYIFSNLPTLIFSGTCKAKFIKVSYHCKSSILFAQSVKIFFFQWTSIILEFFILNPILSFKRKQILS